MNENIRVLLEKVSEDQELQAKFSQIKDPDEAYAVASSIQPGFTKEELIEAMTAIRDSMNEDLTDDDMAKSAGGDANPVVVSVTVSVATAISDVVVAAAAI